MTGLLVRWSWGQYDIGYLWWHNVARVTRNSDSSWPVNRHGEHILNATSPDADRDIRARFATDRQLRYRAERERIRSMCESDRQAEASRQYAALVGTPAHIGAPEDFGTNGPASTARGLRREDADARSAGSASRQGIKVERMRVACECVLDGLYMRENGALSEEQYLAGMRFRRCWLASRHASRVCGDYATRMGGSSPGILESEYRTDARIAIDTALELLSPAQRRAVIAICGEDERLGFREKPLRLGLTALAEKWMRPKKSG